MMAIILKAAWNNIVHVVGGSEKFWSDKLYFHIHMNDFDIYRL